MHRATAVLLTGYKLWQLATAVLLISNSYWQQVVTGCKRLQLQLAAASCSNLEMRPWKCGPMGPRHNSRKLTVGGAPLPWEALLILILEHGVSISPSEVIWQP